MNDSSSDKCRPAVPPKPASVVLVAAARNRTGAPGPGSNSDSGKVKRTSLTRSASSSSSILVALTSGGDGDNAAVNVISRLRRSISRGVRRDDDGEVQNAVSRERDLCHQLSQGGAVGGQRGLQKCGPKVSKELQPTWTSYVDTENPVHPGAPDRLERSLIQDVDVKLAEAESLVAELTLDRLGKDNDGGEDNCNLEAIFERKRRISRALDLLQQKMIYGEGGHKLACSEPDLTSFVGHNSNGDHRAKLTGRSFNLFRDDDAVTDLSGTKNSSNADDIDYLSDQSASSSSPSVTLSLGKVKEFLFDSFGKGRKKKTLKARPVIGGPITVVGVNIQPDNNQNENGNDMLEANQRQNCDVASGRLGAPAESVTPKPMRAQIFSDTDNVDRDMTRTNNRASVTSSSSASSSGDSSSDNLQLTHSQQDNRRATKALNIAKEIMTSEQDFVEILRLLNVEFRDYISSKIKSRGKSEIGLSEEEFASLFSNLDQLQKLNSILLNDFQGRVKNWSQANRKIADVIVKTGHFLKIYTDYVENFAETSARYLDYMERHEEFARLVHEFQTKPDCRGLQVISFMLKPVQRLPQYRLLLENYIKALTPDDEDYGDAVEALGVVSEAAEHANEKMKQNDNFKKLLHLQTRLGESDLVQANRELLREGAIQKISRSGIDMRYLILCSDTLIIARYASAGASLVVGTGSAGKSDSSSSSAPLRTRYKIPLSSVKVSLPAESFAEEHPTDFKVESSKKSCIFRASTQAERDAWVAVLKRAVDDDHNRRATFASAVTYECADPGKLGESAPIWVPDVRVTMCQRCHVDFTILIRRHHCRACGKVVCSECSDNRAPLKFKNYEAVRVCDQCYDELFAMMDYDERLKAYRDRFLGRERAVLGSGSALSYTPSRRRIVPSRLRLHGSDQMVDISGHLYRKDERKGVGTKRFKRLWFVLKDMVLYAYRAPEDTMAKDTMSVLGYQLELMEAKDVPADLSYLMSASDGILGFRLTHTSGAPIVFVAESQQAAERWTKALKDAVSLETSA